MRVRLHLVHESLPFDMSSAIASSRLLPSELDEPLLRPNPGRFVLFPIEHHDVWQFYKKSQVRRLQRRARRWTVRGPAQLAKQTSSVLPR